MTALSYSHWTQWLQLEWEWIYIWKSFYQLWLWCYYLLISTGLGFFVELLYLFKNNFIINIYTP